MIKKILMWSIYAGVVGLLIFGAVIRTEAKTNGTNIQQGTRQQDREIRELDSNDSTGRGRSNRESQGAEGSGKGSGGDGSFPASGEQPRLVEGEDHAMSTISGSVSSLDPDSLWIMTDQGETLEITGRAWQFMLEQGMDLWVQDQVVLNGFYEDGEFQVTLIEDLSRGTSLQVREDSGRPLWSGGAGR